MLLSRIAANASSSSDEWATLIGADILAFGVIFVLEWWLNDFVSIISSNKVNNDFTHKLRHEVFDAIMRQDTVFFEKLDCGAIQQRLNSDSQIVCDKLLHLLAHSEAHVI